MPELDHTNRPVPEDETPETIIKVWEVTPHFSDSYDSMLVRGWQEMLDQVRNIAEHRLEGLATGEPEDDVTIRICLREMRRDEYDEAFEN